MNNELSFISIHLSPHPIIVISPFLSFIIPSVLLLFASFFSHDLNHSLSSSQPPISSFLSVLHSCVSGIASKVSESCFTKELQVFLSLPLSLLVPVSRLWSDNGSMPPPSGGETHGSRPEKGGRRAKLIGERENKKTALL